MSVNGFPDFLGTGSSSGLFGQTELLASGGDCKSRYEWYWPQTDVLVWGSSPFELAGILHLRRFEAVVVSLAARRCIRQRTRKPPSRLRLPALRCRSHKSPP